MKNKIFLILSIMIVLLLSHSCTERIFLETVNGFVRSDDDRNYFLKFEDYPSTEFVLLSKDNDSLRYCLSSCEENDNNNENFVLNYLITDGDYDIFFLDNLRDTLFQTSQYLYKTSITTIDERDDLLEIVILDVEQGDSFIIITPENKDITVIDGGYGSLGTFGAWAGAGETILLDYLLQRQMNNIYTIIETHHDGDHYGGLDDVEESSEIEFSRYIDADSNDSIFVGDTLFFHSRNNNSLIDKSLSGQIFNINYPPNFADSSSENNRSIFFKLNYKNFDMLFTGDIEEDVEDYILENFAGNLELDLDSEILKIAHHGSRYSTTDEFLDLADPNVSIISAGAGNPYNHPTEEVIEKLSFNDNKIFRTDIDGTIKIFTDGKSIEFIIGVNY